MALLLSLETSTSLYSCALHQHGQLIAAEQSKTPQSTASGLAVSIDRLFASTGLDRSRLDAVAVAAGPGSYTGLRIGVATAKGICFALGIPLVAVDTLYLMAVQCKNQFPDLDPNGWLCPMLDARRMEVYCTLLDSAMATVSPTQALVVDESSFSTTLADRPIYFFGEGAEKCKPLLQHPNAFFLPGVVPSAVSLGPIAEEQYHQSAFADLEHFEPLYLKDFLIKKPKVNS